MTTELFIGLMSGTSMDGIDAVLVELAESNFTLRHALNVDYATSLGTRLRDIAQRP
ncbi:MAG: anhydro-N-acetylmuramic acid kinase, partial [Gammaproteobacteria bacterium]|nr:anhydro-N-acetylmuramic acid kinase [Gammaproteobacteria bacterium]